MSRVKFLNGDMDVVCDWCGARYHYVLSGIPPNWYRKGKSPNKWGKGKRSWRKPSDTDYCPNCVPLLKKQAL